MCLIALRTENFKIATKDITCYKVVVVDEKNPSTFYPKYYHNTNFKYVKDTIYTTKINAIDFHGGISAYDLEERDEYGHYAYFSARHDQLIAYTQGFHSSSNKRRLHPHKRHKNTVLVRCTIPKGSEYIINKSKLIISNSIRIDGMVQ